VLGDAPSEIPEHGVVETEWQGEVITVLRATHTAANGFDLVIKADKAAALWEALVRAGARSVGHDALNILRIEASEPRYGIDMDETTVVTETNLDAAVSYTKGCYIGQEIIARIKYRGHVAKKLSGLMFERMVKLSGDVTVRSSDDKEIGRLTSFTVSPHLGCTLALGYVKYDYIAAGTEVKVLSGGDEFPARITELPFVREVSE
jgi:folate-binding protein YgfZ